MGTLVRVKWQDLSCIAIMTIPGIRTKLSTPPPCSSLIVVAVAPSGIEAVISLSTSKLAKISIVRQKQCNPIFFKNSLRSQIKLAAGIVKEIKRRL